MQLILKTSLFISLLLFAVACQESSKENNNKKEHQTTASIDEASDLNDSGSQYLGKDWTLVNLNGDSITLSDSQGKPTLLVFWATWCPYCKKLLPGIEQLHEKYSEQGLVIYGVNIKEDWKPKVYWENHGYQFDALLDGDEVANIYAVTGTPTLVFIAPSGKVLSVQSFSDPNHPLLEKFAQEGIASIKTYQSSH